MSQTAFSHDIRILACQRCGAAVEGGTQGGTFTCRYCNAVNQFAARDDSADLAIAARGAVMDEAVRIDRLREQDGLPLRPPAEVAALMQDGKLAQAHADSAWAAWQTARTAAAHGGDFGAEERLYFLTLLLNEAWSTHYPDKARPLLETALELMSSGRYRQVLRCELGRSAVRLGDIEAARAWLAPCNPYSDDIHADSAYRLAGAYCSAKASDAAGIQRNLGRDPTSVPIADQYDDEATLLRAHALELQGEVAHAKALLKQQETVFRALEAERFPDLPLCAQAFRALDVERARIAAAQSQPVILSRLQITARWWSRFAWVFFLAGCPVLFYISKFEGAVGDLAYWFFLGGFGTWFGSLIFNGQRGARTSERLRKVGVMPIPSVVISADGITRYGTTKDIYLPGWDQPLRIRNSMHNQAKRGDTLRVLVDPADPRNVVISPDDPQNVSTS